MKHRQINLYDFDHTVYDGDCTLDFYFFCVRQHPRLILGAPRLVVYWLLFLAGVKKREAFKYRFYASFLPFIETDTLVESFWEKNFHKIKPFYLNQREPTDIIISASPYFLVVKATDMLGARLIASDIDQKSGRLVSENCRGEQKVTALRASGLMKPGDTIRAFYSDSISDKPLALLADKKFLVAGKRVFEHSYTRPPHYAFVSLEFIRFILVGGINVAIGTVSASLLSYVIHPLLAFLLGYIVALIAGFFLMSAIVFDNKILSLKKFFFYCFGYVPNFIIQAVVITIMYNVMGSHPILAYFCAAIIAVPVTFLVMKLKVFRVSN